MYTTLDDAFGTITDSLTDHSSNFVGNKIIDENDTSKLKNFYPHNVFTTQGDYREFFDINTDNGSIDSKEPRGTLIDDLVNNSTATQETKNPTKNEQCVCDCVPCKRESISVIPEQVGKPIQNDHSKGNEINSVSKKVKNSELIKNIVNENFQNIMKSYHSSNNNVLRNVQNSFVIILIGILFLLFINLIVKISRKI
jgi:hypothetical protein